MADFNKSLTKVLLWEGGKVDDKDDPGGRTAYGITQRVYSVYYPGDVWDATSQQVATIYKTAYWKKINGDAIHSQSVAELLMDFAVNSGVQTASKKIQALVGVEQDGQIGSKTVKAINEKDPKILFNALHDVRAAYYKAIVAKRPTSQKYLKGWMNRLNSYTFEN